MLVPELWAFWQHTAERPPLRTSYQHSEREDFRHSLVLAHHTHVCLGFGCLVPGSGVYCLPPTYFNDYGTAEVREKEPRIEDREEFRVR